MWKQGLQGGQTLETLSDLTVRIIRLFLYTELTRGQNQLRASGTKINLTAPYLQLMQTHRSKLLPKKSENFESFDLLKIDEI